MHGRLAAVAGLSTGARRLIINVDDGGIHGGAVEAAVRTITDGLAASGSVMAVRGGTPAALELLADRPEVPVGVHLTLTRDLPHWAWAPLTRGRSIQEDGLLLPVERREELLHRAEVGDVEAEFRAQIEEVLSAGVQPTHLDWHCLADGGREDVFEVTLALAEEYRTTIRAWTHHGRRRARERGYGAQDQPFLDSFALPVQGRLGLLLERVRTLPNGLSEWAMHPATPGPGDTGAEVRAADREVLLSPLLREALDEAGVAVLGYGDPELQRPA